MRRRPDMFANFDESQLTTKAERKNLQLAKDEYAAEEAARTAAETAE
jgi:tRNA (guanine37-N1)-methyltransferase